MSRRRKKKTKRPLKRQHTRAGVWNVFSGVCALAIFTSATTFLISRRRFFPAEMDPEGGGRSKSKRVRTTFTEEQLHVLQANFLLDSNPDGQDLERIANLTGLSKRVTQVWFQNMRARHKKHLTSSSHNSTGSSSSSKSRRNTNSGQSSIPSVATLGTLSAPQIVPMSSLWGSLLFSSHIFINASFHFQ